MSKNSRQDLKISLGYLEHLLNVPSGTFEVSSYKPGNERFYAVENHGERLGPNNYSQRIGDISLFIRGMCAGIELLKETQRKELCRLCRQRIYHGSEMTHIPGTTGWAHARCKEENDARHEKGLADALKGDGDASDDHA